MLRYKNCLAELLFQFQFLAFSGRAVLPLAFHSEIKPGRSNGAEPVPAQPALLVTRLPPPIKVRLRLWKQVAAHG